MVQSGIAGLQISTNHFGTVVLGDRLHVYLEKQAFFSTIEETNAKDVLDSTVSVGECSLSSDYSSGGQIFSFIWKDQNDTFSSHLQLIFSFKIPISGKYLVLLAE